MDRRNFIRRSALFTAAIMAMSASVFASNEQRFYLKRGERLSGKTFRGGRVHVAMERFAAIEKCHFKDTHLDVELIGGFPAKDYAIRHCFFDHSSAKIKRAPEDKVRWRIGSAGWEMHGEIDFECKPHWVSSTTTTLNTWETKQI